MQIYVVNLDRRTDRLAAMMAQLACLGLTAQRIRAIDAAVATDAWLAQIFAPRGPLGAVPKGDQCCSLSHRRAWMALLASGETHATVLEDDVVLDKTASTLLRDTKWIGNADVIKLEHFGPEGQRVLVGEQTPVSCGYSKAPILSRHAGAAAYVISRRAAERLLSVKRWAVPVDHLLFNPNVSPLAEELRPLQLLPAIARQGNATSDIRHWRLAGRRVCWGLIRRELVRAYYECRLLPQQIVALLRGTAHLARVGAVRPPPPPALRTGTKKGALNGTA